MISCIKALENYERIKKAREKVKSFFQDLTFGDFPYVESFFITAYDLYQLDDKGLLDTFEEFNEKRFKQMFDI